jgi:hypothetical protein
LFLKVGFLGFFGWVFYCQPCQQAGKERSEVFLFLERVSSQELSLLVLSLLATLFNVAR